MNADPRHASIINLIVCLINAFRQIQQRECSAGAKEMDQEN